MQRLVAPASARAPSRWLRGSVGALVAVPALTAAGCTPQFDPGSLVKDERLIAVIADAPEAVPGAAVTLTAVVASPTGTLVADEGFTAEWWRCPDEDSDALGDFWECSTPSARRTLGAGGSYVDAVPADLFGELPTGGEPQAAGPVSTPKKGLGALLGYWRVVGVTIRGAETGNVLDGFKREPVFLPVPLATLDPKLEAIDVRVPLAGGAAEANTNPLLTAVTVHEGAVDGPAVADVEQGGTYFFVPRYDARAFQAYQSLKADLAGLDLENPDALQDLTVDDLLPRFQKVQRCEIPIFNWYVTAGRVRREVTLDESVVTDVYDARGVACPPVEGDVRTPDTQFTAPTGEEGDPLPEDGVVHAWVVLRDGRGGTAVQGFDLPLR